MKKPEKNDQANFQRMIQEKENQKLRFLAKRKRSEWLGLSMFGIVGWSIATPTFLGTLGGIWLDKNYEQSFSWTLTCLILGLGMGCIIAWNLVTKKN